MLTKQQPHGDTEKKEHARLSALITPHVHTTVAFSEKKKEKEERVDEQT